MKQIDKWLEKFKNAWLSKDIDAVFSLIADDVEYWETPFNMVGKNDKLRGMWQDISPLENMELDLKVLSTDKEKDLYTVLWHFRHDTGESAGLYLVGLNSEGICNYFYRCSIPKKKS